MRLNRSVIIYIYLLIIFIIFIIKTLKKGHYSSGRCKDVEYDATLPTTSVIIVFYNEPQTSLLRTVHSVLEETPPKLLEEIILVDDNSDEEELGRPLSRYVKRTFPGKVKLIRLYRRRGLIKARLRGASDATGDVLAFLDVHCEVTKGWLPPLLQRIKEKRDIAVMPVMDTISDSTLEYKLSSKPGSYLIGGFSWSGNFKWIRASEKNLSSRASPLSPIITPTISGGAFVIGRKYFWEIGSFDDQMDSGGGENLEMSFRIWQCGGSLEVIPCSRVGHIFRKLFAYKLMGNKDTLFYNTARLTHVWMDEYKRFFFYYHKKYENNVTLIGNFDERVKLREQLKCKSFQWYLQNVYPEKFIPDENVDAFGKVSSRNGTRCLDSIFYNEVEPYYINVNDCDKNIIPSQNFSLSKTGHLIKEEMCAIVDENFKVIMDFCGGTKNMEWELSKNGAIVHLESGLCLDGADLNNWHEVRMAECNGNDSQSWKFDIYSNDTNRGRAMTREKLEEMLDELSNMSSITDDYSNSLRTNEVGGSSNIDVVEYIYESNSSDATISINNISTINITVIDLA